MCDYILYYDTQIDVERCRQAHTMWRENRAGRENLLWVKDLRDEPTNVRDAQQPLPILKMVALPTVGWYGDEALAKMRELYQLTDHQQPEPVVLPPSMIAAPPPPPVALLQRSPPRYVLYTNDIPAQIKVPADGIVNVQSFDLIVTTLGDKLPKWLRQRRALPVLATLEEQPTVWYGQAARDYCLFLTTFHGGLMLF